MKSNPCRLLASMSLMGALCFTPALAWASPQHPAPTQMRANSGDPGLGISLMGVRFCWDAEGTPGCDVSVAPSWLDRMLEAVSAELEDTSKAESKPAPEAKTKAKLDTESPEEAR